MEVVSGDNWSYKTCKAAVKSSSTTNRQLAASLTLLCTYVCVYVYVCVSLCVCVCLHLCVCICVVCRGWRFWWVHLMFLHWHRHRQTERRTDRHTDRQTDRQTDRHPVGCSSVQTGVCLLVRHKQETGWCRLTTGHVCIVQWCGICSFCVKGCKQKWRGT